MCVRERELFWHHVNNFVAYKYEVCSHPLLTAQHVREEDKKRVRNGQESCGTTFVSINCLGKIWAVIWQRYLCNHLHVNYHLD